MTVILQLACDFQAQQEQYCTQNSPHWLHLEAPYPHHHCDHHHCGHHHAGIWEPFLYLSHHHPHVMSIQGHVSGWSKPHLTLPSMWKGQKKFNPWKCKLHLCCNMADGFFYLFWMTWQWAPLLVQLATLTDCLQEAKSKKNHLPPHFLWWLGSLGLII